MKAVKWILAICLVLAVLFAGVLAYVAATFDPNDYKQEIAGLVKDKTGRTLTFGGDIQLSVFPWIGASTGAITLSNAQGFGDTPFVRLQSAEVGVKLLPLLSGAIEIGTVTVDGLNLNLMRAKSGRTNWDDLTAAAEKGEQKQSEPAAEKGSMDYTFALGGLEVSNADVSWKDAKEGKNYSLNNVSISLGEVEPGQPFDFEVLFGLTSSEPEVRAAVDLSGNASLDLEKSLYALRGLTATVDAKGQGVPGGEAEVTLKAGEADVDLNAQTLSVQGLELSAMGLLARGEATGKKILDAPVFSGTLDIPSFSLRSMLENMDMALQTTDEKALTSVSANLRYTAGTSFANVEQLSVNLDDTTITGEAKVADFSKPDIMFRVKVDSIDADRYLPPASEEKKAAEGQGKASGPEADVIPVDMLKTLKLDGQLDVGRLIIKKLTMTDILVKVMAQNGVLRVKPASLKMYDGAVDTSMSVDVRKKTPVSTIDAEIKDVQAGPLVKDMTGKQSFSGRTNANASLVASGARVSQMKRTLNGDLAFKFNDGVIPGLNVDKMVTETVRSKGDRDKTVKPDEMDETKYGEASGTAKVKNGVATNKDLLVKSPWIRVEGEGRVNLPKENVDYLAKAKVVASGQGQGGKEASDVVGIWVPIRIKGSLSDPSIGVSIIEFLKMLGGGAIKGVTGMVKGGAEGVKDSVKGLGDSIEGMVKPKSGSTDDGGKKTDTKSKDPIEGLKNLF